MFTQIQAITSGGLRGNGCYWLKTSVALILVTSGKQIWACLPNEDEDSKLNLIIFGLRSSTPSRIAAK